LNEPEYPITTTKAVASEGEQCAAVSSPPPGSILHVREKQEGRDDALADRVQHQRQEIVILIYFFFNVSNCIVAIPLDPYRYEPPTPSSFSLYFDVLANIESVKVE